MSMRAFAPTSPIHASSARSSRPTALLMTPGGRQKWTKHYLDEAVDLLLVRGACSGAGDGALEVPRPESMLRAGMNQLAAPMRLQGQRLWLETSIERART